ncbi:kinase-like domain-containing protein [Russula emetica]|nr:kinase-like domain-containing protein [Russula emetica]
MGNCCGSAATVPSEPQPWPPVTELRPSAPVPLQPTSSRLPSRPRSLSSASKRESTQHSARSSQDPTPRSRTKSAPQPRQIFKSSSFPQDPRPRARSVVQSKRSSRSDSRTGPDQAKSGVRSPTMSYPYRRAFNWTVNQVLTENPQFRILVEEGSLQSRRRLDHRLDLAVFHRHLSTSRHNTAQIPMTINYNGLDKFQQEIVQNFKDALKLRGLLQPNEYLKDVKWDSESTLGGGAFGSVYKGEWKGEQVAVKKFRPVSPPDHIEGNFKEKFMDQVKPAISFDRELVHWKMVSKSHSVWPLLGFTMWLDRNDSIVVFALVSPLAEGCLKLKYMDWQSLKPKKFANYENILLHEGRCYLVDFGISKVFDSSSSFSFFPAVAKAQRIPKGLDGSLTRRNKYTDIFSFGCAMYEVLARETLDIATGQPNRPESRVGQEWDAIWNLILRCVSVSEEHDDRPSVVELVESLKAIMLFPM